MASWKFYEFPRRENCWAWFGRKMSGLMWTSFLESTEYNVLIFFSHTVVVLHNKVKKPKMKNTSYTKLQIQAFIIMLNVLGWTFKELVGIKYIIKANNDLGLSKIINLLISYDVKL